MGTLVFTACSVGNFWGEEAPPPIVVEQENTPSSCPSTEKILTGTESESSQAMLCLQNDIADAWQKIQGKEKNILSQTEIDVLINKGVINLGPDKNLSKRKIYGIKRLLNLNIKTKRSDIELLLQWIQKHRSDARLLYEKINHEERITYDDIKTGAKIASSFFQQMNWQIPKEDFGAILADLIDDADAETVLPEFSLVLFDTLGALCPTLSDNKIWKGEILATCTIQLVSALEPGADWFNFILNSDLEKNFDPIKVQNSLSALSAAVDKWTKQEHLDGLHPALWVKFARKMKAHPPKDFLLSLNIINKVHAKSSGEFIHPEAIGKIFQIIHNYHYDLVENIPFFVNAVEKRECLNSNTTTWKQCELNVSTKILNQSAALDMAMRAKNTSYGKSAAPFNGQSFKKITLFHSLAKQIIESFDNDKDGVISSDFALDTEDEVMQLLSVTLNSMDIVGRFVENVQIRLEGKSLREQEPFSSFSHLNMKGMARLVTMTGSDVLVRRTPKEKSFVRGVFDNIFNSFPYNSVQLDQLAITSILTLVDSLGDFRSAYLNNGQDGALELIRKFRDNRYGKLLIDRPSTMQNLPQILKKHFPRTFASCTEWDFERTCGITFDEIMPSPDEGSATIAASNLDLITLIAAAMEGVIDSCDRNGDEKLGWDLFDGEDELDCAFTKFGGITKRLMDSKIVEVKHQKRVNAALTFLNSIFLTRSFAKVAMMQGTAKGIVAAPITLWFQKNASIGSIYSLIAEVLANDKVKSYEKEIRLKQKELAAKNPTKQ